MNCLLLYTLNAREFGHKRGVLSQTKPHPLPPPPSLLVYPSHTLCPSLLLLTTALTVPVRLSPLHQVTAAEKEAWAPEAMIKMTTPTGHLSVPELPM